MIAIPRKVEAMNKFDYDTGVSSSPVQQATNNVVHINGQEPTKSPQENPNADARGALRRRVLKTGEILINQNYADIPCRIRNMSETGVLIEVAEKYIVPDRFTLNIPMDGFAVQCQVIRRQGPQLGIQFIGEKEQIALKKSQSINSSTDPYLESLIRKEKYVVDPLTDTQKAIRRDGTRPLARKPGFGRRI